LLILSLILFFSISCQTPINEISENGFIDSTESLYPTLDKNATIFTIPSPTQVVSTLKIINAPFQDELIEGYCYTNELCPNKYYKALNLGLVIVDFSYCVLNDKISLSSTLLSRLEHLIDELDIQDQNSILLYKKLRDNVYNKDSVSKYVLSAQNSIDGYFQHSDERQVGIWIISSIYLEGLYLLTETYSDLLKKNTLSELQKKQLNILLLHQKLFLPNLCELYNSLQIDKSSPIYDQLEKLKSDFEAMNITFKYDDKMHKISDVKLDNKQLISLNKKLKTYRNEILSSNLK